MRPRGSGETSWRFRAWLLTALTVLAALTIGLSSAGADEVEGGGGEPPGTTEPGETESPPGETESPPAETPSDPPGETESGPGSEPEHSPEPPSHPGGGAEGSTPASSPPSTSTPAAPSGAGSGSARHHHSGSATHHTRSTGTGQGIHAPDLGSQLGASVTHLIAETLPTEQLQAIGSVLAARAGFAPAGGKNGHPSGSRLGDALGVALLGSAVGLSKEKKTHASSGPVFDPIHPGSKTLYVVLLLIAMAVSVAVIAHQFRPVIRTRRW